MDSRFFKPPGISITKMASAFLLLSNHLVNAQDIQQTDQTRSDSVGGAIAIGAFICLISLCAACCRNYCRDDNDQTIGVYVAAPPAPDIEAPHPPPQIGFGPGQ